MTIFDHGGVHTYIENNFERTKKINPNIVWFPKSKVDSNELSVFLSARDFALIQT
jgi:hypothetical protein